MPDTTEPSASTACSARRTNASATTTDRFDDPNLPGEMRVTVSLRPVACGTELEIVQAGIPAAIPGRVPAMPAGRSRC